MAVSRRKKRKNLIMLISLLLVCTAVIVAIVILNKKKAEEDAAENSSSEAETIVSYALTVDAESVTRLEYMVDGKKLAFERESKDVEWKCTEDADAPIKQSSVNSLVNNATTMAVQGTYADNLEKAADFGINSDSAYVLLKLSDGTEAKLSFGKQTPSSENYYYANVEGKDSIISVYKTLRELLDTNLDSFIELPTFPEIDSTTLTDIIYEDKNQSIHMINDPSDLTAAYAVGTTTWYYKIWDRYMPVSYDENVNILTTLTGITYTRCADFNAKSEDLKKYGLDDPFAKLTLKYTVSEEESTEASETDSTEETNTTNTESKQVTVLIGNKTEDASAYYICLEGDANVYECAVDTLTVLTENNVTDYFMSRYPTLCSFDGIKTIDIKCGDKSLQLEVTQGTTKDEDGNETTTFDCKMNGDEIAETDARGFFTSLLKVTADHIIADDEAKTDTSTLFTCTYTTTYEDRPEITFKISEYDSTYYQLTLDGHTKFMITKQEYNTLVTNIEEYLK